LSYAEEAGSQVGTGGMRAKVQAARIALSMGVEVFIGDGNGGDQSKIAHVLSGEGRGTYFGNSNRKSVGRKKQWIAFHSDVRGRIAIDQGAINALLEMGKSLLPAGVVDVHGDFRSEDVVEVVSSKGEVIGKGMVNYSAPELSQVMGKPTSFAKENLGVERVEVIHRDNWVNVVE